MTFTFIIIYTFATRIGPTGKDRKKRSVVNFLGIWRVY